MSRRNPERVRLWREQIETWKQSGQTINAFCREKKLTRSNFDRWRRILAAPPRDSSKPNVPSSSQFVSLRVMADPMAEVVLSSGIVVRLPLSAAPDTVTRLVAAVGAAAC